MEMDPYCFYSWSIMHHFTPNQLHGNIGKKKKKKKHRNISNLMVRFLKL